MPLSIDELFLSKSVFMTEEKRSTILIVDDEPNNVELLEALLFVDYEIMTASGGQEALDTINKENLDLVLLDIMMPEITGYEVCEHIKSSKKTQFLPVIMVSALTEREDRIKSIEAGADDFLSKPVDRLELTTRVKSLIRIKQLQDSLVSERDQLEMQNKVRSIMTNIVPTLLASIPMEQKKIIVHQMVDMVETIIKGTKQSYVAELNTISDAAQLCCDTMNQLGGSYYVERTDDEDVCLIKAQGCPWGKVEARLNPIMCNLTTGVFMRIINQFFPNSNIKVQKTLGNGDQYCHFEIRKA
ncbi:methanogen output domain 1-containing protein [Methanococcoides sp. SA1]|nr:methanogen output domain 1-containing protein [Methanococcoides sp. SA1]